MVVLRPIFPGEQERTCPCGHLGIVSPIPERSGWYPKSAKNRVSFRLRCRSCFSATRAIWYSDPAVREAERARGRAGRLRVAEMTLEQREAKRRQWREWRRAQQERDPEGYARRHRASVKRNRQKRKEELGPEALRELNRIDRMLRAERRGKPLKTKKDVEEKFVHSGWRLPKGPFCAYVADVLDDLGREGAAFAFGYSEKNVLRWLSEVEDVDYTTVDRAATSHGQFTPEQIYWDYGPKMVIYEGFVTRWWEPGWLVVHWWEPEEREEG